MRYFFFVSFSLFCTFQGFSQYTYDSQIGTTSTSSSADGQFEQPNGVAIDADGNIYIADRNNERVQKFDSSGDFLLKWGSSGTGDGQFSPNNGAVDLAVDSDGNIWVIDRGNHRIQKFNSSGTFLLKFGSSGTGDGQFNQPTGITINSGDTIYVGDRLNERVQAFDKNGNFLFKWGGTAGSGDGQFASNNGPVDLAVDSGGNVFVIDRGNHRVQKFTNKGVFLGKFGSSGSGASNFNQPNGISVAPDGTILIADRNNARVSIWTDTNNVFANSTTFGSSGTGNGQFNATSGAVAIAFDPVGDVWVIDRGHHRVQKFDGPALTTTVSYITQIGVTSTPGTTNDKFDSPAGVGVDTDGNIFVVDKNNERIMKFDSDRNFLLKWGSQGTGALQFSGNAAEDLAFDSEGNVWVVDRGNDRIMKFDASGNAVNIGGTGQNWIGTIGSGTSNFDDPYGIAINSGDSIYIADRRNERIQVLNTSGQFLFRWGSVGSGDGQFASNGGAHDIAISSHGHVVVADRANHRLQIFDRKGTFLEAFGSQGNGNANFEDPEGVAFHPNGDIWVADRNNERVVIFSYDPDSSPSLTYKEQFGSKGSGNGQFASNGGAVDIAFDSSGDAWVVDRNQDRVQKFDGPEAPVTVPSSVKVAAKVILEGAWNNVSAMNTILKEGDLVSKDAPYNGVNSHAGSESVINEAAVPDGAVDWVLVELREAANADAATNLTRKGSAAGFLMNTGEIKATNGVDDLTVTLSNNAGTDYFVVIYHRNHLPIMSASAVPGGSGTLTIDFRENSNNTHKTTDALVSLVGSKFGMPAGDIDQDGDIDAADLSTWRSNNGVAFSYAVSGKADFNLDGVINAVDRNEFHQKNLTKIRRVPQ